MCKPSSLEFCHGEKGCHEMERFLAFCRDKGKQHLQRFAWTKKGNVVVKKRAVCVCHYREVSAPFYLYYFLLIYIGAGKTKRKGRMGKERSRTEEKASPTLSGEGPKAWTNPSGWSRDPFGMESGTRTSGFLMREN